MNWTELYCTRCAEKVVQETTRGHEWFGPLYKCANCGTEFYIRNKEMAEEGKQNGDKDT